jgi:hypothetical protein
MPKRLTIIAISAVFQLLWILALPWFVLGLNRKITRQSAIRRLMIPQPSRLILRALMAPAPYLRAK